ncbi:hypothetical protein C7M84_011736 [Penaeus vannamei]|uniref:Neurogenic mastermind-like N-terminal domain-containing protein n=1 Tax=Penaeus vannamei TaxID=6689 RepID=A0A423T0G6_PENVA|nr:hypothetical protein C7M84_011736 [Penaeus vannamei]
MVEPSIPSHMEMAPHAYTSPVLVAPREPPRFPDAKEDCVGTRCGGEREAPVLPMHRVVKSKCITANHVILLWPPRVGGGTALAGGAAGPDNMADLQDRQVVFDRLKRRLSNYRHNHNSVTQRYDTSIDLVYSSEQKQTSILKQRHIESKAKKSNKKTTDNKKQDNSSLLATMGQSKMLARGHDQTTSSGESHENEPAAKKQRLNNGAPPHGGPHGATHAATSHGGPPHVGGPQASGAAGDINNFQMVQQLPNMKKTNSPVPAGAGPAGATTSASNGPPVEDVKKEQQDLDIALLDDIEDFSNIDPQADGRAAPDQNGVVRTEQCAAEFPGIPVE